MQRKLALTRPPSSDVTDADMSPMELSDRRDTKGGPVGVPPVERFRSDAAARFAHIANTGRSEGMTVSSTVVEVS